MSTMQVCATLESSSSPILYKADPNMTIGDFKRKVLPQREYHFVDEVKRWE